MTPGEEALPDAMTGPDRICYNDTRGEPSRMGRANGRSPPMTTPALDEAILAEIVERIVAAVAPERIVLFGSHARSETDDYSDIDLFVQIEPGRSCAEASQTAYEAIRPLRSRLVCGVDIVVKDRSFVERYGDLVGTVVRPVLRDGRPLYVR